MQAAVKRAQLPPRSWVHLEVSIKGFLTPDRPSMLHLFISYITHGAPWNFVIFSYSNSLLVSGERRTRAACPFLSTHLVAILRL